MNRAERRAQQRAGKRTRHELIPWPKNRPLPIKGMVLSPGQLAWTCTCQNGWCTITPDDPTEAFDAHVKGR